MFFSKFLLNKTLNPIYNHIKIFISKRVNPNTWQMYYMKVIFNTDAILANFS